MKLSKNITLFTTLLMGLTIIACAGDPSNSYPNNIGEETSDTTINVQLLEPLSTTSPARVSTFMRLDINGEPVAGLDESAFTFYENGKEISTFEAKPKVLPNPQKFRVHSLILIDLSGSVTNNNGVANVRDAVSAYIEATSENFKGDHYIAIRAFDGRRETQLISEFNKDPSVSKNDVELISCENEELCLDTSTNLNGAILSAVELLSKEEASAREDGIEFQENFLVVFTDGTDQAGLVKDEALLDNLNQSNTRRLVVGVGKELDESTLRKIQTDGFELSENINSLDESFERIAKRVSDLAASYYRIDYCSPKRDGSGEHNLKIDILSGELSGSVEGSFSAKGFTFGCNI